jgi:hypothetical protein
MVLNSVLKVSLFSTIHLIKKWRIMMAIAQREVKASFANILLIMAGSMQLTSAIPYFHCGNTLPSCMKPAIDNALQ